MSAHKKQHWTPLHTPEKKSEKKTGAPLIDSTENLIHKAEIERMKKLLSEKIKDPKLAKKAAVLITEMLNNPRRD
jgi:hypothetical protein